jgi:hypothetical protein
MEHGCRSSSINAPSWSFPGGGRRASDETPGINMKISIYARVRHWQLRGLHSGNR